MTDNEKRAHDMSIILLNRLMDMKQQDAIAKQESQISIDAYSIYMDTYQSALKLFNRDFPEGK